MNILLIDTSTSNCHVSIKSGNSFSTFNVFSDSDHTEHLLVIIDAVFKVTHLKSNLIDYVIVGTGPGSFTGIRISHSLLKGLFFQSKALILPVPTISLFSFSFYLSFLSKIDDIKMKEAKFSNETIVHSLIYGKKNRFYYSKYLFNKDDVIEQFMKPYIHDLPFEEIDKELDNKNNFQSQSYLLIDDFNYLPKQSNKEISIIKSNIDGIEIINFFEKNLKVLHNYLITAKELLPLYIRKSDAEENSEK